MIFLIAYDFIAILFSYLVALWVRFDCNFGDVPELYLQTYFKTIFIYAIFCILVFWVAKLYRSIWRFAMILNLSGNGSSTKRLRSAVIKVLK